MKAAIDHHDLDEAARQGMLAGPAIVLHALRDHDRPAQLAGIAAAPQVEDRAELLGPLAKLAGGPDRRTAIPAARAALQIARKLALPIDDVATEDLAAQHDAWLALATRPERWIELRVIALQVAAALGDVPLASDPDPAIRLAAVELQPTPAPASLRPALAALVATDVDDRVAVAAAQVLCLDHAFDALDPPGVQRLATLAYRCR